MKKFIKDGLETLVEDNDRRIPDYLKNGWKEAEVTPKATDEADKQTQRAIDDVETSEGKPKNGKRKRKSLENVARRAEALALCMQKIQVYSR